MANVIFGFPDRSLNATISGGSWNASYPLTKLKSTSMGDVARSNNLLTTSTLLFLDLGFNNNNYLGSSDYAIKCLALLSHNLSFTATIRFRGYSDPGYYNLVDGADTGVADVWPNTLSPEDVLNLTPNYVFCFPTVKNARYWKVEITDLLNPDGYVQFARCWISEAFMPTIGASYGASLGYSSNDIVEKSLGGVRFSDQKEPERVSVISMDALDDAGEKRKALLMQKVLTTSGEMLYVLNGSASSDDLMFEAFPCNVRQASPLKYPYFKTTEFPLEVVEIVPGPDSRTIAHGTMITFAAPLTSSLLLDKGVGSATFTRASDQWGTDDTGKLVKVGPNVPFFNSKGILCEPAATNLMLYSQQFNNAAWGKTNVTVNATNLVGADGTLTGSFIAESATTSDHLIGQYLGTPGAGTYTISFIVTPFGRTKIKIYDAYTAKYANFTLSGNGTVDTTFNCSAAIEYYAAYGYYRISMTMTVAAGAGFNPIAAFLDSSGIANHAGDVTKGFIFWQGQTETGITTSPIMTTSAAATRAACSLTYPTTGNVVDSEGTMYVEWNMKAFNSGNPIIFGYQMQLAAAGLNSWDGTTIGYSFGTAFGIDTKGVCSWKGASFNQQLKGGTLNTFTYDGAWPVVALMIGAGNFVGYIKNARIYSKQLTAAQIASLLA